MENILKGLIKLIKVNENTVSLLLGMVIVVVVGGMIYNYFQDTPAQLPVIEDKKINEILSDASATESGDLEGQELANLNEVEKNNLISPTKVPPTMTPTVVPTNTPKPTTTPLPTNTPSPTRIPTSTVTPKPTNTPVPFITPTVVPTLKPTLSQATVTP